METSVQEQAQPVVSSPITPAEQKETPAPRTLNKGIFLIMALVVILISVGIGMMLYNNNKPTLTTPETKTGKNIQEIQELTDQAKQFLDETGTDPNADSTPQGSSIQGSPLNQPNDSQPGQPEQWQTYQSTTAKFSISYPSDLQTKEAPAGFGVNVIEFRNPNNSAVPPDYQILLMPKFLSKTIGQDFDKYYALSDNTTTVINGAEGTSQRLTKLRNRMIGTQRAFDFRSTSNPEDPIEAAEVGTYVEMGNNMAIVSTTETNRSKLDLMLTTFKYPL